MNKTWAEPMLDKWSSHALTTWRSSVGTSRRAVLVCSLLAGGCSKWDGSKSGDVHHTGDDSSDSSDGTHHPLGCDDTGGSEDSAQPDDDDCGADHRVCDERSRRDLIAGQTIDAGEVYIENDETTLTITLQTEDDWLLEEVHIHVGASQADIPSVRLFGSPAPGHFDHVFSGLADGELTLEVPLADIAGIDSCGAELVIAVHAVVARDGDDGRQVETAWACGRDAPGASWAMYVDSDVACCEQVCDKESVQSVLHPTTGMFLGNAGPDEVLILGTSPLQDMVDAATDSNDDGFIILMVRKDDTGEPGGGSTENLTIRRAYSDPFALIGCSITLSDADRSDGLPTASISAAASSPGAPSIFVMDIHAEGSDADGWLIEGEDRYLRNSRAVGNAGAGVRVVGDDNRVHNAPSIAENTVGVLLEGSDNLLTDCEIVDNTTVGVQVTGDRNQLHGNDVGTPGHGNGGDGIFVTGAGDGPEGARELYENVVEENAGVGIRVTGAGHDLQGNQSGDREGGTGDNLGCEYEVVEGNYDGGDNRANSERVGTGGAFPTGCLGSPE